MNIIMCTLLYISGATSVANNKLHHSTYSVSLDPCCFPDGFISWAMEQKYVCHMPLMTSSIGDEHCVVHNGAREKVAISCRGGGGDTAKRPVGGSSSLQT